MVPGFQKELYESRNGYAVFIGKENIGEDGLHYPTGDEDIRIAPVVSGSGRGGVFQIVLGAVLVAAAFWTGGASLGAGGVTFSGLAGQAAYSMGAAMILGGVSQLLVKTPNGITGVDSPENGASYNFNGPVNVTAQGNPVPILYGEMITGSVTISGDMYAEDQQ